MKATELLYGEHLLILQQITFIVVDALVAMVAMRQLQRRSDGSSTPRCECHVTVVISVVVPLLKMAGEGFCL